MLRILLAAVLLFNAVRAVAETPSPPSLLAKSWVLGDVTGGQILAAKRPDARVAPASLTKLMTAYLVFGALRDKHLALDQQVKVSAHAAAAPGARMYLQPGLPVTVDQLIRGMEVDSGNDAARALAEAVAGSEAAFVRRMNSEARRLGMDHTHYTNPTGLPQADQYSTARDLYTLARALIENFPRAYARYYALKEFRYNDVTQANRNRLLWVDPSVDGVKTGYTEAAGYCLIASSKRGPRRLLAVLLGAPSDSARVAESLALLSWGFRSYESVRLYAKGRPVKTLRVWKGSARTVPVGFTHDFVITLPKGAVKHLKADLRTQQPLVAPVAKGQTLGELDLRLDGRSLGRYPVVALAAVPRAGVFRRVWDTLRLWIK